MKSELLLLAGAAVVLYLVFKGKTTEGAPFQAQGPNPGGTPPWASEPGETAVSVKTGISNKFRVAHGMPAV